MAEMGRVSDIAAVHSNHISAALAEGGKVFMWGQCRGQSVTTPTATPLLYLHDVLACYSTPPVMHEPLALNAQDETSILDCLRQAFDDPVSIMHHSSLINVTSLFLLISSIH